jgi:hypothetical protein
MNKDDVTEYGEYEELYESIFPKKPKPIEPDDDSKDFDDSVFETDFSQFKGKNFKSSFSKAHRQIEKNKYNKKKRKKLPLTKDWGVGNVDSRFAKDRATIMGCKKGISKVIVPRDRSVIVEGVSKFILSNDKNSDSVKNIGYYEGKKLKKLILQINNDSAVDFNVELFNPSEPLDYLYSTSLNLNDKISVAGSGVSYSDILYNFIGNSTMIVNATMVFTGPTVDSQISEMLAFTNKKATGEIKIHPINLNFKIDNLQVFKQTIYFDIMRSLNRPFIPDGMDVIKYKVLPFNFVTLCFYYKQISMKKVFFKEARASKKLL